MIINMGGKCECDCKELMARLISIATANIESKIMALENKFLIPADEFHPPTWRAIMILHGKIRDLEIKMEGKE